MDFSNTMTVNYIASCPTFTFVFLEAYLTIQNIKLKIKNFQLLITANKNILPKKQATYSIIIWQYVHFNITLKWSHLHLTSPEIW